MYQITDLKDLTKMEEVTGFQRLKLSVSHPKVKVPDDTVAMLFNTRYKTLIRIDSFGDMHSYVAKSKEWTKGKHINNLMTYMDIRNKVLRPVEFTITP